MKLPFAKLSGAGNDFILLSKRPPRNLASLARRLCDRREGIGADGLLILEKKRRLRLTYLNADGSSAFCGNGTRCAAWWAKTLGWTRGKKEFVLDSNVGPLKARIDGRVIAVSMPSPKRVRFSLNLRVRGKRLTAHYLVIGVPHAVVEVKNVAKAPLDTLGPALRRHITFGPPGANVDFISIRRGAISLRTYERGVEAETLACGTGAVASAVAAYGMGKVRPPVTVKVRGGTLRVQFKTDPVRDIWLEGPARLVYKGMIIL